MNYAVMANPECEPCLKLAAEVAKKKNALMEERTAHRLGRSGTRLEDIDVDVIITIGGDGTILLALQRARGKILGVNMGLLGFLTEAEPEDIWKAIDRVENGDYIIDRRMKLAVYLNESKLYDCVNEAVVHTSEIAKLRSYRIKYGKEVVDEVRADGIIISTPTGSTSYAMSAGGPVLHPSIEAFVVVPIAPFRYTARVFVLPAEEIEIESMDKKRNLLVLDGQYYKEMKAGDTIKIAKSENYAEFIRFESSFFNRIQRRIIGR